MRNLKPWVIFESWNYKNERKWKSWGNFLLAVFLQFVIKVVNESIKTHPFWDLAFHSIFQNPSVKLSIMRNKCRALMEISNMFHKDMYISRKKICHVFFSLSSKWSMKVSIRFGLFRFIRYSTNPSIKLSIMAYKYRALIKISNMSQS